MEKIRVEQVNYSVGGVHICKDINLDIQKGLFYGIIGPNGSGKSTLMKQICRVLQPTGGLIYLNGRNINGLSYKESARELGVLLQENELSFDYTVKEMVMMGRAPYHSFPHRENEDDNQIVLECLEKVNMTDWADRRFITLSGGEKQRVLLARALAQQADTLLLDEPTNNLDIGHQYNMFELLKSLQLTTFIIIHDMNLACEFCDILVVVADGRVISVGKPAKVMTEAMLRDVFSIQAKVTIGESGKPFIKYLRSTGTFN